MSPYQQRVVDEHAELEVKRTALINFIKTSPKFEELEEIDQKLLVEQWECMVNYTVILEARIARFK